MVSKNYAKYFASKLNIIKRLNFYYKIYNNNKLINFSNLIYIFYIKMNFILKK